MIEINFIAATIICAIFIVIILLHSIIIISSLVNRGIMFSSGIAFLKLKQLIKGVNNIPYTAQIIPVTIPRLDDSAEASSTLINNFLIVTCFIK